MEIRTRYQLRRGEAKARSFHAPSKIVPKRDVRSTRSATNGSTRNKKKVGSKKKEAGSNSNCTSGESSSSSADGSNSEDSSTESSGSSAGSSETSSSEDENYSSLSSCCSISSVSSSSNSGSDNSSTTGSSSTTSSSAASSVDLSETSVHTNEESRTQIPVDNSTTCGLDPEPEIEATAVQLKNIVLADVTTTNHVTIDSGAADVTYGI